MVIIRKHRDGSLAETTKDKTVYGFIITWSHLDGSTNELKVSGYRTPNMARLSAIVLATQQGWTRPKWWQWWRRKDTKVFEEYIKPEG